MKRTVLPAGIRGAGVSLALMMLLIGHPALAARSITVGGYPVEIPNSYVRSTVEYQANLCFHELLPGMQTEASVRALALSCTQRAMNNERFDRPDRDGGQAPRSTSQNH